MNWINLHTDTLRSETYLGAEPVERATWLNLIGWCCTQENGGIIPGAAEWSDRKFQQLCGVTKSESSIDSKLYHFTAAGDLVVNLYPAEKETEVRAKRDAARTNGKRGGRPKKPPSENPEKPTSVFKNNLSRTQAESGREGKGKDKGKREKETRGEIPPPALALISFPVPDQSLSETEFCDLTENINSCRPAWQEAPAFSKHERAAFLENLAMLRSIKPGGWQAITAYLAARLPQGSAGFQPQSREKFLAAANDVLTRALDWQRKQTPPKPKPKAFPQSTDPPLSAAETAAILGLQSGT